MEYILIIEESKAKAFDLEPQKGDYPPITDKDIAKIEQLKLTNPSNK